MKHATRQKKQLETVRKWLARARECHIKSEGQSMNTAFYTLIALEQLVKYLEQEKEAL